MQAFLMMLLMALSLSAPARSQDNDKIEDARQLYEQSRSLYREGKYREGTPLAKRSLEIREAVLGGEHPDTAAALHNLGNFYTNGGRLAEGGLLLERALVIREKVLGPEHPDTAASLNNVAIFAETRGDYKKAERLHLRSLAIREKIFGPEHLSTSAALNNLALIYQDRGDYAKAESMYRRVIAIRERALGPEHPEVAGAIANLAGLYDATSWYDRAETLHQRALAIREKAFGPDHPLIAVTLNDLAIVYSKTGDYARAEGMYLRALAIDEKALGNDHPNTALRFHNLANLYHDSGKYEKSEQMYRIAIAARERVLGAEHPLTARSLYGLGVLYTTLGAYRKAEPLYLRALAIQQKTLGSDHPHRVDLLGNLALLYWATGNTPKALQLLQRVRASDARNAERFILSGSESRNSAYFTGLAEAVFNDASFAALVPGRDSAALGLMSVLQYKGRVLDAAADATGRLRRSLRVEDRALFEQLAEVANEFSTLTYQGAGELSRQAYGRRLDSLARKQEELETVLSRRSSEFGSQVNRVALSTMRRALPADAALVEWFRYEALDPQATRADKYVRPARYMAFVLKRVGDPVALDLGSADEIEGLAAEFRLAVSNPGRSDFRQHAAALSLKLVAPLRAHLGGVRHLMLSPDGFLNLLPMAALLDEKGRFLAERFEITYLTTGRDLLRIAASDSPPGSNAIVMANPSYGRRDRISAQADRLPQGAQQRSEELDRGDGLSFRPLPGTALEAAAIQTLLQDEKVRVLTGEAASETSLKQLRGPRILHLATHGFFLSDRQIRKVTPGAAVALPDDFLAENPLLRSGLALAGANERRSGFSDDGILTALEVSRLDLRGTELVVLSACETGLGEIRNGDGITGLRRSLLLTGAQTQVSSLWKVADLPTKDLMVNFYQHLVRREGRSAALRQAQLDMLANPLQSHPYFWAGFVSVGDWKPLSALQ